MTERVGAALNMVPVPVGMSMFSMPVARALQVAQGTGVFVELARGPANAEQIAERLGLRSQGARRLLDVLVAAGQLELDSADNYKLPSRTAKWLDPSSKSYVCYLLSIKGLGLSHRQRLWAGQGA